MLIEQPRERMDGMGADGLRGYSGVFPLSHASLSHMHLHLSLQHTHSGGRAEGRIVYDRAAILKTKQNETERLLVFRFVSIWFDLYLCDRSAFRKYNAYSFFQAHS